MLADISNTRVKSEIQAITKLDLELNAYVNDIRQLNDSSFDRQLDKLNTSARKLINSLKFRIEILRHIAEEQDTETDRQLMIAEANKFESQLSNSCRNLRDANIRYKAQAETFERNTLLNTDKSSGSSHLRQRTILNKENIAKSSSDITNSMRSLTRMMAASLEHSQKTLSTLVSSSQTIQETTEEFRGMGSHIHSSKVLLTKYKRRQLTDKVLIFLALTFFFACVLYILRKRVFSRIF